MFSYAQIMKTLQPWVGSRMLPYLEDTTERILTRFAGFSARDDLDDLVQWLEAYLYDRVREITRGKMVAGLDDGSLVTIRVSDFTVIADEMLYLLFSSFPRDARHLLMLREYSLRHESLSALRALYVDFRLLISEQERHMIKKVILHYPEARLKDWLDRSPQEE